MEAKIKEYDQYSSNTMVISIKKWWTRFHQSTLLVDDCSTVIYSCLVVVVFSFSILADNLLDVFHSVSHESESIAAAYVSIKQIVLI